jgi:hypothetical protein
LRLQVTNGGVAALNWTSQPIDFGGNGLILIAAIWGSAKTGIHVNGVSLFSAEMTEDVHRIETGADVMDATPSWHQPHKNDACAEWIAWRRKRFSSERRMPRRGRRLKSIQEQVTELRRAARSTADIANLVLQGHTHLLGHLATELRALLFWNGRSYDPLLLRLAARKGLALPMFAVTEKESPPFIDGLVAHVRRGMPSHTKLLPVHILIDLQAWLMTTAVSEPAVADESSATDLQHMSVIDVIAGIADTLGAAHYDQDTPTALDLLRSIGGPNGSEIVSTIIEAARVVVPLCVYVADEFPVTSPPNTR